MKRKLVLLTAAFVAAAALIGVPLTAASSVGTKLQIGQSLRFAGGPGASSGTFVASGAIRDSGTVTSQAVITPLGNQQDGRLEGTETFVGRLGTFRTEFSGIAGPVGAPHEAGKGTFRIVGGTGAYADLRGQGTFLVVVDFSTLQGRPNGRRPSQLAAKRDHHATSPLVRPRGRGSGGGGRAEKHVNRTRSGVRHK